MRFPDSARSIGRARTEAAGFVFCDPGSTNAHSGDASFTLRADAGLLVLSVDTEQGLVLPPHCSSLSASGRLPGVLDAPSASVTNHLCERLAASVPLQLLAPL